MLLPLRSVKRAKCGNWTKNRCFSEASAEEEQKIGNFAITESRNDRFSHLTLQKTVRYPEMVRITERKRLGQRLQMIICLRGSIKKRKHRWSIFTPYSDKTLQKWWNRRFANKENGAPQRATLKEKECVSDSSLQLGLFEKFVASILSRLLSVNSGQIQMFLHLPVLVHCILMYFSWSHFYFLKAHWS